MCLLWECYFNTLCYKLNMSILYFIDSYKLVCVFLLQGIPKSMPIEAYNIKYTIILFFIYIYFLLYVPSIRPNSFTGYLLAHICCIDNFTYLYCCCILIKITSVYDSIHIHIYAYIYIYMQMDMHIYVCISVVVQSSLRAVYK